MTFVFREIQPQDDARIAAIIRQVLTEFGANRPGFAWSDPDLEHLSQTYLAAKAVYYIITVEDEIIGGGGLVPFACQYQGLCEVQKMYILPAFRGQGIGQALLTKLLTTAQAFGYRGCYLETLDTMQSAMSLYKKLGFEPLAQPLGNSGHSSCNRFLVKWLP